MCEQNALYLAKHSELESKNLNTICLNIIQKGLKIAIAACKFTKIFRGRMWFFLFLHQLQTGSAEKNTLEKNAVIMPPPPF